MNYWQTFNTCLMIVTLPAFIFYLIFTILLFQTTIPTFKTSFFTLMKLLSIVDLSIYALFFFGVKLGNFPILFPIYDMLSMPNIIMTVWVYGVTVLQHSKFIIHTLVAFNRFVAIVYSKSYDFVWKNNLLWAYFIALGLPACYMTFLIPSQGIMKYTKIAEMNYTSYMMDNVGDVIHIRNFLFLINITVTLCLCILMDSLTLFFLNKRKKSYKTPTFKTEVKLFGVSSAMLITHFLFAAMIYFVAFFPMPTMEENLKFAVPLFQTVTDLCCLASPFYLLALNPKLFKVMKEKIWKRETFTTNTIVFALNK